MESVFESMREENAEMTARLLQLQNVIDHQAEMQSLADERIRELNAERSEALMTFMRQHAEEDHRKAERKAQLPSYVGDPLLAKDANRASNGILQLIEPLALTSGRCCGGGAA